MNFIKDYTNNKEAYNLYSFYNKMISKIIRAKKKKELELNSYKQVVKLSKKERDIQLGAILTGFLQLLELGVLKFLSKSLLPKDYKAITARLVLKLKRNVQNLPYKYKARLVARGFL